MHAALYLIMCLIPVLTLQSFQKLADSVSAKPPYENKINFDVHCTWNQQQIVFSSDISIFYYQQKVFKWKLITHSQRETSMELAVESYLGGNAPQPLSQNSHSQGCWLPVRQWYHHFQLHPFKRYVNKIIASSDLALSKASFPQGKQIREIAAAEYYVCFVNVKLQPWKQRNFYQSLE